MGVQLISYRGKGQGSSSQLRMSPVLPSQGCFRATLEDTLLALRSRSTRENLATNQTEKPQKKRPTKVTTREIWQPYCREPQKGGLRQRQNLGFSHGDKFSCFFFAIDLWTGQ